ncbi:hypothetical protein RSOLAG1IB_10292 [Rhizoctonia solani AG-1 IB]|uniref:Uncharacterized protein n=1 Tax=Thanatephorus cucumeris (strain AG1-IB / isolate 7/3/14) TaxID=1108050 RepID=A0A0B7G151_THACB|nr:hypothetical protein RSOLAG1IB_10292 [Rhizoctonia solani AG-1 IB]
MRICADDDDNQDIIPTFIKPRHGVKHEPATRTLGTNIPKEAFDQVQRSVMVLRLADGYTRPRYPNLALCTC